MPFRNGRLADCIFATWLNVLRVSMFPLTFSSDRLLSCETVTWLATDWIIRCVISDKAAVWASPNVCAFTVTTR